MEDKIKYAIITAGHYDINEISSTKLEDEIYNGFYSCECINKQLSLYVRYDCEFYCPTDMYDWQYVVKMDDNNHIISLTDDDIKYIKDYHWVIYQVYCWQTCETIMNFINWGCEPDFSKHVDNDTNIAEIENGYKVLYERYKK